MPEALHVYEQKIIDRLRGRDWVPDWEIAAACEFHVYQVHRIAEWLWSIGMIYATVAPEGLCHYKLRGQDEQS